MTEETKPATGLKRITQESNPQILASLEWIDSC